MVRCVSLIVILGIFLACAVSLPAREKVVEVAGMSSLSREDAIRQAQRSAVEEAVGVFIQSESEVENFELKKDKIISRTEGYITQFRVLKAAKVEDFHEVRISATVSLDKIKDDLVAMKILLESMERPKIMILIDEDYKGMDPMGLSVAGTEMSALLASKGFDLVDKAQVHSIKNLDQGRQALAGNAAAAKAIGLNFGAQYVIVGKAVAHDAGEAYPDSGLRSIQASLQLQVVQTQTGMILGSVVKNGVAAHISSLTGATNALKQSAEKAVDEYLVDAITDSFQDYLNNGSPLKLYITGVGDFRTYRLLTTSIETMDRVVSSKKEGWNKVSGLVVLDLRFKGTSDDLAQLLDARDFGEKSLEVVDLAPERVDCNLR